MNESGGVKFRLLVVALVLSAIAYYGTVLGSVYWRAYRFGGAVEEQLSFVGQRADEGMRQYILKEIDDIGLPPEARRFTLVRNQRTRSLEFSDSYTETVNLLFTQKEISFKVTRSRRY
jgi:hypothetical protein